MVDARRVVVLGAGAAGLWAAARAAELGAQVTVLEKTARAGTKILASGGTRCNLTTTLGPLEAAALFGERGRRFSRRALQNLTPSDVRARFAALDVPTVEAPLEKIFPASDRARDVRDALLGWATRSGATFVFEAHVNALERGNGEWIVRTTTGDAFRADRVLVAVGGRSYPKSGTTGDAYAWLRSLDLPLVEPVPALVPLTSPAPWVAEMTGIAWESAVVRAQDADGRRLAERTRPIVFTHHGVSGPGAMDVSEAVARGLATELVVDLVPDVEREELRRRLMDLGRTAGATKLARAVGGIVEDVLPRKLARAVLNQAELGDERAGELDKRRRHLLVEALRGFRVPVDGTRGWAHAEVTAGGLALSAVDPSSMAVRGVEGLFVAGEVLDLQGPIGGLNFQAAWATAELAAVALGR
ncbi:MAG: aminoacetone oxidase family FAD-binding enzyme [Planctomycetota bacterium]